MTHVAAYSILALTVGLSLARPRVGRVRIHPATAAVLGAVLTLACGLLDMRDLERIFRFLSLPVVTIVSLMIVTLIAEKAGIFRYLAWRVARAARGDGRRLFAYLFALGTLTGALFTNDAAVLIFTPMVWRLIEQVKEDDWERKHQVVYYFAVLYVANLAAPLVIGNPINIIVANWFDIGFAEYAAWMVLPSLASILVTYVGLRIFFRRSIPASYRVPGPFGGKVAQRNFLVPAAVVLVATLAGLFSEFWTGVPIAYVAATGAALLLVLHRTVTGGSVLAVARGVRWGVIIFVVGIFVVANGLRTAGLTDMIGEVILAAGEVGRDAAAYTTGFVAAGCSAVMNNHPVADTMALAISDLPVGETHQRLLAFSALIGGDLGPKMLPIGSLAALLWFRILRERGIEISYWAYIRLGIPVTLAAVFVSLLVLNLEAAFFF